MLIIQQIYKSDKLSNIILCIITKITIFVENLLQRYSNGTTQ